MTNEEALEIIGKAQLSSKYTKTEVFQVKRAFQHIKSALEPQPKTGHWIRTGDYYTGAYECLDYFECSCCHEESLEEGDFCPNCGVDMRGDTE